MAETYPLRSAHVAENIRFGIVDCQRLFLAGTEQTSGVYPSAMVNINSVTSATSQTLTLATLDSNANIILLPHGSGVTTTAKIFTSTATTEATTGGAGALTLAGGIYVTKAIVTSSATEATVGGAGSVITAGGIYAAKAIVTTSTTAATTTSSGSIIAYGGVGIGGALYVGLTSNFTGVVTVANATEVGSGTGSLVVTGGAYVTKAATIASATVSTTTTTGALTVAGGVGIVKQLFVGDIVNITGTATTNVPQLGVYATLTSSSNNLGVAGYFEVELAGTVAGEFTYGTGSWINIGNGCVTGSGNYIVAQDNGIYDAGGTLTGSIVIFGMRCESILASAAAELYPFSLNSNNQVITALFKSSDDGPCIGYTNGLSGSSVAGVVRLGKLNNGSVLYVNVYTTVA